MPKYLLGKGKVPSDSLQARISNKLEGLIGIIGAYYKLPNNFHQSKSRNRKVVLAKQMFCYIAKEVISEATLRDISKKLGTTHSNTIHSIKSIKDDFQQNIDLLDDYKNILNLLSQKVAVKNSDGTQEDWYFFDLNNCTSLKINNQKGVVLVGFSDKEAEMVGAVISEGKSPIKPRKHLKTGICLFDRKVGSG